MPEYLLRARLASGREAHGGLVQALTTPGLVLILCHGGLGRGGALDLHQDLHMSVRVSLCVMSCHSCTPKAVSCLCCTRPRPITFAITVVQFKVLFVPSLACLQTSPTAA